MPNAARIALLFNPLLAASVAEPLPGILESLQRNLLTPIPLCFLLGLLCTRIRGGIKIPKELYLSIVIFLPMSIGFVGGHELAHEYHRHGLSTIWKPVAVTLFLGCLTPITSFLVLRCIAWLADVEVIRGQHYVRP